MEQSEGTHFGTGIRSPLSALVVQDLSKSFSGTKALSAVSLQVDPGEIHVLVGENGSGKSTLIKILSGYHVPDPGGEVLVDMEPLQFGVPDHGYRLGCRFVHQDLGLVPTVSVLDNLSLGAGYPLWMGTIRSRAAVAMARKTLKRVGLEIDPRVKVADLGAAQKTGVAVARAIRDDPHHPPKVLVLDEPTATLPSDEVDNLLSIFRTASKNGVAVLFVTHHLDEVFRIADRVTVLRDGRLVATTPIDRIDRATLVDQLVGEAVEDVRRSPTIRVADADRPPSLDVDDLHVGPLRGVSFSARGGEIVGIAGLTGSGRETVLGAIFGAEELEAGTVRIDGKVVRPGRPDLAMAAGMGFLPPDRKINGGIMALSAKENLTLADLRPFWSGIRLKKKKESEETKAWFSRLQVRPADGAALPLANYSGGNQQKILFGKWMRRRPSVFLLDEPTQGVDVGAKAQLHLQLVAMAEEGTSIIVGSTDIEELVTICNRVLVIRAGRITDELVGEKINISTIRKCCLAEVAK